MDVHFAEVRAELERVQRNRRVLADIKAGQKELARQKRLARGVGVALGEALARPAPARRENIGRYR
ncbi:MAG TPA: hypothetical protein VFQ35_19920 [Polyangiaceae bacterium]|nr:hypothetical protein [Polyangiaceae bacterium]